MNEAAGHSGILGVVALGNLRHLDTDQFSGQQRQLDRQGRFFLDHAKQFTAVLELQAGLLIALDDVDIRLENRLNDVVGVTALGDADQSRANLDASVLNLVAHKAGCRARRRSLRRA